MKELEAKNVELEKNLAEQFEAGQASAIPKIRELENRLEIAESEWKIYAKMSESMGKKLHSKRLRGSNEMGD